ncbi:MAG: hypothetical protein AAFQ83_03860 [Bacteroidota bacterium]
MTRSLSIILLSLLLSIAVFESKAQVYNCFAVEEELEAYFFTYSPKLPANTQLIQKLWTSCEKPTGKMELIYYYLRSSHTLLANERNPRIGFLESRKYYRLAAKQFYLLDTYKPESRFVKLYEIRIQQLEEELSVLGQRYNQDFAGQRSRGEAPDVRTGGSTWAKQQLEQDQIIEKSPEVMSNLFRKESKLMELTGATRADADTSEDAYGFMGLVNDVNLLAYLDWKSNEQDAFDKGELYDAGAWIEVLGEAYITFVASGDYISLRAEPRVGAKELTKLMFGQGVAVHEDAQLTNYKGIEFIEVETETGVRGWVPVDNLIEDGYVATVIQAVVARNIPNKRFDRNVILLQPGELLVLDRVREGWVEVVNRNQIARGWIEEAQVNEVLSIAAADVRVAQDFYQATRLPNLLDREDALRAILSLPAFAASDLQELIRSEIKALER